MFPLSSSHSLFYEVREVTKEISDVLAYIVPPLFVYLFVLDTKATYIHIPHLQMEKLSLILYLLHLKMLGKSYVAWMHFIWSEREKKPCRGL